MYVIVMKSERTTSGWEPVHGHDCFTLEEMNEYVALFGASFKVVPAPFDPGQYFTPPPKPPVSTLPHPTSEETRELLRKLMEIWKEA